MLSIQSRWTSAQGMTSFELAASGQLPSGTYSVQVIAFTTVNATYAGNATLGPEPTSPLARATSPAISRSANRRRCPVRVIYFSACEASKRGCVPNALGNIYTATIQGVPAAWNSRLGWWFSAMTDSAALDNPIWHALTTAHQPMARGAGLARRHPSEVLTSEKSSCRIEARQSLDCPLKTIRRGGRSGRELGWPASR